MKRISVYLLILLFLLGVAACDTDVRVYRPENHSAESALGATAQSDVSGNKLS